MSGFWSTIKEDQKRYQKSGALAFLRTYWEYPGFRYSFYLRLQQHFTDHNRKLLAKLATVLLLRYQIQTGIQINPGCRIGPGLYMPHFGTIVVNPSVTIGDQVYLSHNVTLGKVHTGKNKGTPTIGNHVFIGAGAVLIGRIKVHDNAVISPNSVVIDDVPENAVVAGQPAKIISMKGARAVLGIESVTGEDSEPTEVR